MATKLFLRDTTDNAVSGYKDMTTTAGSSVKTVNSNTTTAGGTDIPFATGIWISGYTPAGGFTLTTTDVSIWQLESAMTANIGGRYRVYHRAESGTETLLAGGPFDDGVEMDTAIREDTWTGNPTDRFFDVNERIVIKFAVTNVGVMEVGHTGSIQYDAADAATGDSFFNIAETVSFSSTPIPVNSASLSPSASVSPSSSVSPSPSAGYTDYSRGNYNDLPTDDADLENIYSTQDVTDVGTSNNVRVSQTATGEYAVHLYKNFVGGFTSANLSWEGQTDFAPATSTVFLQIYNRNTTTWETVASNNSASVNTDFTITGLVVNLTNYKDASDIIACRIYQQSV